MRYDPVAETLMKKTTSIVYILLFAATLLLSCNRSNIAEVDGSSYILTNDNKYLEITIDTISKEQLDRYNPYCSYLNYKAADPLLYTEPDKNLVPLLNIDRQTNKLLPTPAALMVTDKSGFTSTEETRASKKAIFFVSKEEMNNPATICLFKGFSYASHRMYSEAIAQYMEAEKMLEIYPDFKLQQQLNTNMAELHRLSSSNDSSIIYRYYEAIEAAKKLPSNEGRLANLYSHLASTYMYTPYRDSALFYLNKSNELANSIKSRTRVFNNVILMMALYNMEGRYRESLDLAEQTVSSISDISMTYRIAESWLGLDELKKAKYYYDKYGAAWSDIKQYVFLSDYYTKTGDYKRALHFETLENRFVDSVRSQRSTSNIANIESQYRYQQSKLEKQRLEQRAQRRLFFIIISLLALLLASAVAVIVIQKSRREEENYNSIMEQIQNENNSLNALIDSMNREQTESNSKLAASLQHRLETVNKLLTLSYQFIGSPDKFVKHYKETMEIDKVNTSTLDDICTLINSQYNNLIKRIKEDYPHITPDEERLIALICAKYSTMSIAVLFNATSLGSVYNKKSRLLKKLNIETSLEEFIASYATKE